MIELSRLQIIGKIDHETPVCVIHEVAESLSILHPERHEPANVIVTIGIVKPHSICQLDKSMTYTPSDLSLISRFVNSEIAWTSSRLMTGFHHLLEYMSDKPPVIPTGKWLAGRKTMENPMAYDASMLYKICRYYRIQTTRSMTISDMALAVVLLQKNTESLRGQLFETVPGMSKSKIISLLLSATPGSPGITSGSSPTCPSVSIPPSPYLPLLDMSRLSEAQHRLRGKDLIRRVKPRTHYEAIVLGAMSFELNLTECQNPIEEYEKRQQYGRTYVPSDPTFRVSYQRNPLRYNIRETWIPALVGCYTSEQLYHSCLNEGFTEGELTTDNLTNLLHLSRVTPTFHLGLYGDRDVSPVSLDSFEGVEPELILSYGIPDADPVALLVIEWAEAFQSVRRFVNPARPSERIEARAIQKLILLVSRFEKEETSRGDAYRLLRKGIDVAMKTDKMVEDYCNGLRDKYAKGTPIFRDSIRDGLTYLSEIGYYMRGWKVSTMSLPIKSIDCVSKPDRQDELDDNVTQAIIKFEDHISKCLSKDLLTTMPLITLSHGSEGITFIASEPEQQGYTVWDRLKIVKDNKEENVNSCIRLTSNYLLYTYHFFSTLLDMKPLFKIDDLSFIS